MKRRTFILGVGAASVGTAGAIGTGAISSVTADRGVNLRIASDTNAYLEFDPLSELAEINKGGITEFDLSKFNSIPDVEGEGFNKGSEYEITGTARDDDPSGGVFGLRNRSDSPIEFASTTVEELEDRNKSGKPGELDFAPPDESDLKIELFKIGDSNRTAIDSDNWVEIGIGVQELLGIRVIVPDEIETGSHTIHQVIVAREV